MKVDKRLRRLLFGVARVLSNQGTYPVLFVVFFPNIDGHKYVFISTAFVWMSYVPLRCEKVALCQI